MAAKKRKRAASTPLRPGRGILTRTNPEGLKALRLLALERDTTLQDLAVEALNDVLAKYGRRRVVRNPAKVVVSPRD